MAVLVPAQGWSAAFLDLDTTVDYRLLGPFSPGCIIERLVWRWTALRAAVNYDLTFGAVVTASAAADIGAWQAGVPVVQRSPAVLDGVPVARFRMLFSHTFDVVMAVGVPVVSGALYVLLAAVAGTADERVDGLVTVFASGVRTAAGEPTELGVDVVPTEGSV